MLQRRCRKALLGVTWPYAQGMEVTGYQAEAQKKWPALALGIAGLCQGFCFQTQGKRTSAIKLDQPHSLLFPASDDN